MKTWRERIAEARKHERRVLGVRMRGAQFSDEDRRAWASYDTCAVGEVADAYGVAPLALNHPENFSLRFALALHANDARACERLLDALEDRALALKREQMG